MGIKKRAIFIIIIISLLLSGHVYLKYKYNPMVVEMCFSGNLSRDDFQNLKEKHKLDGYSMNYEMSYKGHTLIMTTGLDNQIRDINIIHGEYIFDVEKPEIVIGDKIADRYFDTEAPIGRDFSIFGKKYKIMGIEKNSDAIYIPFSEELIPQKWIEKRVNFIISPKRRFYVTIERVENQLSSMGINVIDKVIYKEKIYGYLNLIIILAVIILIKYLVKLIKILINKVLDLWHKYKEVSRVLEWYEYLFEKKVCLLIIITIAIAIIMLIFSIFKLMSYLWIPSSAVPSNLFSLMSYIDVFKLKYSEFCLHLKDGFSNIAIDIIFMNFLFILVLIISAVAMKVKSEKTKG